MPLNFEKFLSDPTKIEISDTVSSGEWTSLYFKKHPNAKIAGENTYGMIHFGNTVYLRLPHSGLSVALCMKINELTFEVDPSTHRKDYVVDGDVVAARIRQQTKWEI